jgi:ABC-2 type transport system ATP-binding protein
MIKIQGLSKIFDGRLALEGVDIHVAQGSIYGLVGTNGAGKTTLLKMIGGIYTAPRHSVTLFGDTNLDALKVKERMQYISDAPCFFEQKTLRAASRIFKSFYPKWNQERYVKLIDGLNLEDTSPISKLSKGQKRLGTFCLALSSMPDLMLMDEPMDGLDPVMRHQVKNLLVQDVAERGMSILMSSHNLRELEEFCDTIGILHQGKLMFQQDLDQMKAQVHKVHIGFSDAAPETLTDGLEVLFADMKSRLNLLVVKGHKDHILKKLNQFQPEILDVLPLALEEIFIYEMGDKGYAIENILL